MQKYRKRQPRTEIVEPIFGMGFDMGKDVEKAAFVGVGGRLEEWYRDDFEREYERVEEDTVEATVKAGWGEVFDALNSGKETKPKPLRCQRCGMSMSSLNGSPRTAYHLNGRGPLCSHCYHDLIRHHPITPKQQLWIDATPEERKALDDSIRGKWLPRLRGHSPTKDCALCVLHRHVQTGYEACTKCILDKAGQRCEKVGSPWMRWYNDTRRFDDNDWRVETQREYERTRDMASSLAKFKPDIDPTRIEVEATPIEWPGVQK